LTAVEKLVHPASGTLHFPVPLEEMLESTKGFKEEYLTKATEFSSPMETSEEVEVNKGVHKRGGSKESKQLANHFNNAPSSSEEVVIVYEDKMEVEDDGDETDESKEEDISENDVSGDSEESGIILKDKVSQSYRLSKMLREKHDDEEIAVINISESDDEFQHKEERSASTVVITDKSGSSSSVEICERDMGKTYSSKTDRKIHSASTSSCDSEHSRRKVATSKDLNNKIKSVSYQDQKKTAVTNTNANNNNENIIQVSTGKGSKDVAPSMKTSTVNKTHLVTEDEELRQDDGHILHVLQESDGSESDPKRIKLDTSELLMKCCKLDSGTPETGPQSKVENSTAVAITGSGEMEQPVNGVAQDPKDVTEEEMLQAFVDVLSE
jgi:hypothetical protein